MGKMYTLLLLIKILSKCYSNYLYGIRAASLMLRKHLEAVHIKHAFRKFMNQ